jgi:hypothetical protein
LIRYVDYLVNRKLFIKFFKVLSTEEYNSYMFLVKKSTNVNEADKYILVCSSVNR